MDTKEQLLQSGIIAIFRRLYGEELLNVCDALYEGGIRAMEVTFDQSDPDSVLHTTQAITALCHRHSDITVGAGTVLTVEQLIAARDAGAVYMVAPNVNAALIAQAKAWGMAAMPGAMTPTEVVSAWEAGADLVKLFPAGYLGTEYIRHLHAPLGHIPLVANAGITPENFAAFLEAGCVGAGISGVLTDRKCIAAGDYGTLTSRAAALVHIFEEHKHR